MKTSTMLIGGAVLVAGGYLIYKATQPQPKSIFDTLADIGKNVLGALKPSSSSTKPDSSVPNDPTLHCLGFSCSVDPPAPSTTAAARVLPGYNAGGNGQYNTGAWSSYGDAAISDGAGFSRLSGRTAQQPYTYMTRAQNAQFGNINYGVNHFALKT